MDVSCWKVLTKHDPLDHGRNGKPFQYTSCEDPMNSTKRQKHMTPKDEFPQDRGVQQATGEKGGQGQGH